MATATTRTAPRFRLPDGSRSDQSVWVWRGFLLMALVAGGLALTFASSGLTFYAGAWTVIAVGWFGISMWLWRRHLRFDQQRDRRG